MHPCMLGHVIVHFFPIQLETFIRRRRVVTIGALAADFLTAASAVAEQAVAPAPRTVERFAGCIPSAA